MKNLMTIFIEDPDNFFRNNWNNYFWILIIFIVMSSLIFKNSLDSLKGASILAVISIFTFVICMIIIFLYKIINGGFGIEFDSDMLWPSGDFMKIIASLPTVFLAFTFQFNVFPIYFTLLEKTNANLMLATRIGVNFCLTVYLLTGYMGYFMYKSLLKDSILEALKIDGELASANKDYFLMTLLIIINIAFVISAIMSIPLMFFSLKKNFINTIIWCRKKLGKSRSEEDRLISSDDFEGAQIKSQKSLSPLAEKIIIVALYCTICLISICIPYLQTVKFINLDIRYCWFNRS
jgi:amino acid permease